MMRYDLLLNGEYAGSAETAEEIERMMEAMKADGWKDVDFLDRESLDDDTLQEQIDYELSNGQRS